MTKKATPTPPTPETETPEEGKPIVFLRSHPDYAYNAGNRATLSQHHTDLLVNGGFARFDAAETAEAPTDETR